MQNTSYEEFNIKNVAFREWLTGILGEAMVAGCVGTLSHEPEIQTLTKNCGLEVLEEITKTTKLNLTMEGHYEKDIIEKMFCLTSDGLITGVKGFNKNSVASEFALVAEINNMTNTDKKYIAYPRVSNVSGFVKNVDNGATEMAYISLNLTAVYDKYGYAYYEGYESDIEDEEVKTNWLTEWTPELMQETPEA